MTKVLVDEFNDQNRNNFLLNIPTERKETILSYCSEIVLSDTRNNDTLISVLECMKILARDLSSQKDLCKSEIWYKLFELSTIIEYDKESSDIFSSVHRSLEIVEGALKVLCNMTKNFYTTIPNELRKTSVSGILNKIRFYCKPAVEITISIKILEMKLLFLLTALFAETRSSAIQECDCLHSFAKIFKSQLDLIKDISVEDINLNFEILKCLFNVLYQQMDLDLEKKVEQELRPVLDNLKELVVKVYKLENVPENMRIELLSNTANLLTSIPDECFQYLLFDSVLTTDVYKDPNALRFYELVLDLINRRLTENRNLVETLCPLMHAMGKASLVNRDIRKFCRLKVLPYMKKEVMELPEQGSSIRNKLCRLLQHLSEQVTESVAFFLFIICKEDVERAIKYTGFGNFAGFLARHALLAGRSNSTTVYSESEDSDTEEYLDIKDKVNPVTGRVEENHPNPLEGMTEEQKEYEVVRLMNQIDLLQKQGIIKPGIIGDDGSVRPAESVLEVVEKAAELKKNKSEDKSESSDSD